MIRRPSRTPARGVVRVPSIRVTGCRARLAGVGMGAPASSATFTHDLFAGFNAIPPGPGQSYPAANLAGSTAVAPAGPMA